MSTDADDHRSTDLVYVCIRLVSHSHFADPKKVDPDNVWDLLTEMFLALEVQVLLQNLQRHYSFTLTIGAHWRKMRSLDP